jgi:DNA-binding PucR family transcriptional regulator
VRYDEIALEALVVHDERLARKFAERALGPLAAPDVRTATLRETLRAYFSLGQNASAAGALLRVNDRTIAYRLGTIADRLGYPVTRRRDELALALRIHDLFAPDVGRPVTGYVDGATSTA